MTPFSCLEFVMFASNMCHNTDVFRNFLAYFSYLYTYLLIANIDLELDSYIQHQHI